MSSNYARHIIGPNIQNVIQETGNFPLIDYDAGLIDQPGYLEGLENASEDAVRQYLHPDNIANREAFNNSYHYINSNHYVGGNQIVTPNDFSPGKYETQQFANDMIAHLNEKNVDFAHYVSHLEGENLVSTPKGTSLEKVLTTDGSIVSVDPTLDAGQIANGFASLAAGATVAGIGYGIKNIAGYFKNKKNIEPLKIKKASGGITPEEEKILKEYGSPKAVVKGLGQIISGGIPFYNFAGNTINSINMINGQNSVNSLLGWKGLLYNSGMFLMGLGAYSVGSLFADLYKYKKSGKNKKDRDNSFLIRSAAKGALGGLELAAGLSLTYYGGAFSSFGFGASMTSLIYEGSGLFSISTAGISSAISSGFILGGALLGIGIAAGAILYSAYKSYKKRKSAAKAPVAGTTLPPPPVPAPVPSGLSSAPSVPAPVPSGLSSAPPVLPSLSSLPLIATMGYSGPDADRLAADLELLKTNGVDIGAPREAWLSNYKSYGGGSP